MRKSLSHFIFLGLLAVSGLGVPSTWAAGGIDSGGGDLCEDRIKVIRDDLRAWIDQGGHKGLRFSAGVSPAQYADAMLRELEPARISCVSPGDAGYPVTVNGTPKVCRFDRNWWGKTRITCDASKFKALGESDQYVLIHHEYAGLAQLEVPNQDDSDYHLSNQISGYLEDVVVKKLVVKPLVPPPPANPWKGPFTIDPQTRAAFKAIGDAIAGTRFSDCKVEADWSDVQGQMRGLTLSDSGIYAYYIRFFFFLNERESNQCELIQAAKAGDPLELRCTGMNFLRPDQVDAEAPLRLSVFVYLSEDQKRVEKVGGAFSALIKKNVGTVLAPIYQQEWSILSERPSVCTAVK